MYFLEGIHHHFGFPLQHRPADSEFMTREWHTVNTEFQEYMKLPIGASFQDSRMYMNGQVY